MAKVRPRYRQRRAWLTAGRHGLLILFAIISAYPILVTWFTALRPARESQQDPFGLPWPPIWENVANAWVKGRFGDYLMNSVIIAVPTVIGVVVLSALAGYGIARFRFPGRALDRCGPTRGDGVVALAGVESAVGGDSGDLLFGRDLVEQFGQHRGVANVAGGELSGPDLQCFLIDSDVDLAPDAPFGATMLAGVPLAFTLDLDPGAVDQQVQRAVRTAVGNVHLQGLLAPT